VEDAALLKDRRYLIHLLDDLVRGYLRDGGTGGAGSGRIGSALLHDVIGALLGPGQRLALNLLEVRLAVLLGLLFGVCLFAALFGGLADAVRVDVAGVDAGGDSLPLLERSLLRIQIAELLLKGVEVGGFGRIEQSTDTCIGPSTNFWNISNSLGIMTSRGMV